MAKKEKITIADYDYSLPDEKIAKYPLKKRDHSKLLVYDNGEIYDKLFFDLPDLLPQNISLYFNNTKVLYARLPFKKPTGAKIEIFCLEPHDPVDYAENLMRKNNCIWHCLVGNLKKWKFGHLELDGFSEIGLIAELVEKKKNYVIISFHWKADISFAEVLEKAGNVPIPPYLNRKSEANDKSTYQTLYSKIDGSVAAPTAGLHFTNDVMARLDLKGVEKQEITLHVGAGTFRPVENENVRNHTMHQEYILVTKEVIESLLNSSKFVYAVGTTTVRTLESLYWIGVQLMQSIPQQEKVFEIEQWEPYQNNKLPTKHEALKHILTYIKKNELNYITAYTKIIIVPEYNHQIVNGLITNFHQPRSTLLLLLASFVGADWQKMYNHALGNNYRFLSYGDSCLVLCNGL